MTEQPMTRDEELDLLVARGWTRPDAEGYLAELDDGAATVTDEERDAQIAELYASRPDLKPAE